MAVRVAVAVPVEEVEHFGAAAGEEEVVFPDFVVDDLEHGAVEVGVEGVAHMELEGFVAVDRDSRREEFARVPGAFREEVRHLAARHVDDGDRLAFRHVDAYPAAGGDPVCLYRSASFGCQGETLRGRGRNPKGFEGKP